MTIDTPAIKQVAKWLEDDVAKDVQGLRLKGSLDADGQAINNVGGMTAQGDITPTADNSYSFGSSSAKWANGYFAGALDVGSLNVGGTEVITCDRILQNVTASRSVITDFFDSPFWVNIPDKPKLYITNVVSVTSDYTANVGDVVLVDASGGAITITLPSPSSGAVVNVKKVDSSTNAVVVDGGGANVDGQTSIQIAVQHECYTFISDGNDWWII